MICSLSKWFISNSADNDKAIPKFIRKHSQNCRNCLEFEQLTKSLDNHAALDAQSVIRKTPPSLIAAVTSRPALAFMTDSAAKPKGRYLRVFSVSVVLSAVVILSVIALLPTKKIPAPPLLSENTSFLFSRDSLPGETLQKLASEISIPYNEEWQRLRTAVQKASRNLTDQISLRIGPPQNQ